MSTQQPPATTLTILPLGALLQRFTLGPKQTNIVLGFPSQSHYPQHNAPYFGETIGRYANRISNASFSLNNNTTYTLAANNASNSLHGGVEGWGKKIWTGPEVVELRTLEVEGESVEGGESLKYSYRSVHLEEGFPGTVDVSVVYTTGTQDGGRKKVLGIEYEAVLVDDEASKDVQETVVNITNHSYFNLAPENDTIEGTEITLTTNLHLPLNELGLPTSYTPIPYPGIEANTPITCTTTTPKVDDCFVPSPYTSPSSTTNLDTRSLPLLKHVSAYHPQTKLHLEVSSTEPSFQFYTGIYIDVPGDEAEGVRKRGPGSGFCVEPGRWVDAVNSGVEDIRKQVVLKKGEVYGSKVVYRGWSDE